MLESEAVSEGIRVRARSFFVPERSNPDEGQWLFAYRVTISNEGSEPAKLLSRHWIISDGEGREEEVRGPGVVGEQPRLAPGERFEYTSACPLATAVGSMRGSYQMVRDSGAGFEARIAPFSVGEAHAFQ